MKIFGRMASRILRGLFFCVLALPFVAPRPVPAQKSSPATSAAQPVSNTTPVNSLHGILKLDGPWRFQKGDDLRWAEPDFDDSNWPVVTLDRSLVDQGFETYSGYAWYRLRLQPQQIAAFGAVPADSPLEILVTGDSVGQITVYVNNADTGHTLGMGSEGHPSEFLSPPFIAHLSDPNAHGERVLALRTWAGPTTSIGRGLLTKVEIGTHPEIADRLALASSHQWAEHATAPFVLAFLFFSVAILGLALYLSQRHHSEYLWLAILCCAVGAGRVENGLFGLAILPLHTYRIISIFTAFAFVAVTLEFVLRFTASPAKRTIRGMEIVAALIPFIELLPLGVFNDAISLTSESLFCIVVTVLLFQAWRRGRGDAGAMLVPFFLSAATDIINVALEFAGSHRWIAARYAWPQIYIGPNFITVGNLTDAVFLCSLIAVILFRFIRVSEDEQRANAEISAARSVQALLIPTHLPSHKHFMLESAYLPVHGVGGDFFQVLPLKDDSLLIVVGDVSGKGLQAAMNSSTLVGALRNELSHDPATILEHLNHVLLGAVSSPGAVPELDAAPCFATCLCARIYPDGTLTISNAGHLSPYRDGRELVLPPGLPLGVIADSTYEQTNFHLNRGDRLVFLSDGVVEATNTDGELFGFERTQQVSHEPARFIAQTARRFGQTDDITVVSLYVSSRTAARAPETQLQST